MAHEWNFDGLVGPTHNYAGLSSGNLASQFNAGDVSSPKSAALQGLKKMKALADRGYKQAILPPQIRPRLDILRSLGFSGSDGDVLAQAYEQAPHIFSACYSASTMWTANAATVSPSADTQDGRVHFSPANLVAKFHRSLEPFTTENILNAIFSDDDHFYIHSCLPLAPHFGDEGAANHTRFCQEYGQQGVEFFVYGQQAFDESQPRPKKFVARQTLEASQAIARIHELDPDRCVFAQQNPEVIDAGVFHNDVIAVGNRLTLFCHEKAYLDREGTYEKLRNALNDKLEIIEVKSDEVRVEEAVTSYLFNSQLLALENGKNLLVAPTESQNTPSVKNYLDKLVASQDTSLSEVLYLDVTQSMKNGGGPACLRLRVVLTEKEAAAMNQKVILNDITYETLVGWVNKHYREELRFSDLKDPAFIQETQEAVEELAHLLDLGEYYF